MVVHALGDPVPDDPAELESLFSVGHHADSGSGSGSEWTMDEEDAQAMQGAGVPLAFGAGTTSPACAGLAGQRARRPSKRKRPQALVHRRSISRTWLGS